MCDPSVWWTREARINQSLGLEVEEPTGVSKGIDERGPLLQRIDEILSEVSGPFPCVPFNRGRSVRCGAKDIRKQKIVIAFVRLGGRWKYDYVKLVV